MPASPTSWKREPFKEGVSIPYRPKFESDQFSCLKEGFVPKGMDDRWFIYYEEPHLFLHRSWTGLPVYRVKLKHTANGAEVTESLLSIDLAKVAEQSISQEELNYQAAIVDFLISNLLLHQRKPFPRAFRFNHVSDKMSGRSKAVLMNVCIVGTLVWCYYCGYPLVAILISAFALLATANVLMYVKHRWHR